MVADFLTELADTCTQIINEPQKNIGKVSDILKIKNNKDVVHLSLLKVFKNIVPLYRIRLHSEKVKHRNGELPVSPFDAELVKYYNEYIRQLCASNTPDSFKCVAELLRTLDHFNFADRVVSRVLVGTTLGGPVGVFCADALVDRIKNDMVGDTVFMILNQCLDYKYSSRVVDALLESKYLHRCVEIRIDKEEKYNKARIEQKKLEKRASKQKGFFMKMPMYGKNERKAEKQRLILQSAAKKAEEESIGELDDKNYVRTVNALQRLYLTVLKETIAPCLEGVFLGLRMYIKLIRMEFREGLYVLLNDAVKDLPAKPKLAGILTILQVYSDSGLDFKRVVDALFQMLHPLRSDLEVGDFPHMRQAIKLLFVDSRETPARANALAQRLMQMRMFRYVPTCTEIIKMLEAAYDIDYTDNAYKLKSMYDPDISDIDRIDPKPYYEYYLYKKII